VREVQTERASIDTEQKYESRYPPHISPHIATRAKPLTI